MLLRHNSIKTKAMKPFLYIFAAFIFFTSCKTSKDYLSRVDEDRTLFDVVKQLNKKATDTNAIKALPIVYEQAQTRHASKISTYSSYKELSRWDKIYESYTALQKMYDAIYNSPAASAIVTPISYDRQVNETKELAAEDYYQNALMLLGIESPERM